MSATEQAKAVISSEDLMRGYWQYVSPWPYQTGEPGWVLRIDFGEDENHYSVTSKCKGTGAAEVWQRGIKYTREHKEEVLRYRNALRFVDSIVLMQVTTQTHIDNIAANALIKRMLEEKLAELLKGTKEAERG